MVQTKQQQQRRCDYYKERRFKRKWNGVTRRCLEEGCNTVLNSYNRNLHCSLHHFAYIKKIKPKGDI